MVFCPGQPDTKTLDHNHTWSTKSCLLLLLFLNEREEEGGGGGRGEGSLVGRNLERTQAGVAPIYSDRQRERKGGTHTTDSDIWIIYNDL